MKSITIKWLLFCVLLFVSKSTLAITYLDCFKSASKHYGVPFDLLIAVSFTESSFKAKAINGRLNKNGSVDYGLMQINSLWRHASKPSGFSWKAIKYQPCANIKFGAWILRNNYRRLGSWSKAIGAYNAGFSSSSKAQARRSAYYRKVVKNKSIAKRYQSRLKKKAHYSRVYPKPLVSSLRTNKQKNLANIEDSATIFDYTPKPLALSISIYSDLNELKPVLLHENDSALHRIKK